MPDVTSSSRVDVGERRDPKLGRADQLGVDAARPEGDQRPEDGILDEAGQQLDAAGDHRLDDDREADALDGGTDLGLVAQVEGDAARLRLVRAGLGGLDDDREAELGRRRPRPRRRSRPARSGTSGKPKLSSSSRTSSGVSQPSSPRARRRCRDGLRAREVDAVQLAARCPAAAAAIRRAGRRGPSARGRRLRVR